MCNLKRVKGINQKAEEQPLGSGSQLIHIFVKLKNLPLWPFQKEKAKFVLKCLSY